VSALAGAAVGAFDVDVSFDPALFALQTTSFALSLGDPGLGEALTSLVSGAGSVTVASVSLLDPITLAALQGDTVALVTFTFEALTAGAGAFAIEAAQLSDEFAAELTIGSVSPATVDVVPEPGFVLLAFGASGLALWAAGRLRT
jgi:hypothetical protein